MRDEDFDYFVKEPETTSKYKVMRIKQLLEKKAALDREIDILVKELSPEDRQKLYIHNEYFTK